MSRHLRLILLLVSLGAPAFSQCTWVFNPFTRKLDCTGAGGSGNVSTTLPSTANAIPQFSDTNGDLSASNLNQAANGVLSSPFAFFYDSQVVSENGGAPVFDLSTANFFILTLTGNDTATLANSSPISSTQIPFFTWEICDTAGGHTFTPPSGFSLMANPVRAAGECTVQSFWFNSGNAVPIGPAFTTTSPTVINGPTRAAEGTPGSGNLNCWFDATGNNLECINSSAAVSGTAFAQTSTSHQWMKTFVPTTGLFTTTQPDFSDLTGSATLAQLPSAPKAHGFGCTFDGSGSAIPVNKTCYVPDIPYACTIGGFAIDSDVAETVTFKTWRVATGGTARPTSGNSISTSGVSLSSGTLVQSSTVTDWTSTAIAAHDTVALSLTAVTASTHVDAFVRCNQ